MERAAVFCSRAMTSQQKVIMTSSITQAYAADTFSTGHKQRATYHLNINIRVNIPMPSVIIGRDEEVGVFESIFMADVLTLV